MSTDWGDIPGGITKSLIDEKSDKDWIEYEKKLMHDLRDHTRQQYFNDMYKTDFREDRNIDPRDKYEQEIHRLRERLHELEAEKNIDLKERLVELNLRLIHPSVQEAWEQYEIVKKLVQK